MGLHNLGRVSRTTVVFVREGENAEWCQVGGTTVLFMGQGENAEWCVSETTVVFVG